MNYKHLCMIFGVMPSVCGWVICMMLQLIVWRLSNHPIVQVKFPNPVKMRQFADMVQLRAPIVNDVIGFMDGVLIPAECTDERIEQNAFFCGYDCDTMVNNVFAYGPDGKLFFAAINFPGSWADGALTAQFLHALKKKLEITRYALTRGSPGAVTRTAPSSVPSQKGLRDVCIATSAIICSCTHCFGRQASGECVACRALSPAGRNAFLAVIISGGSCWRQLSSSTIIGRSWLGSIKSTWCLTRSMSVFRTSTDTTGLPSITLVLGIMTVTTTGMVIVLSATTITK
jgi:hypothetical protein